MIIVTGIADIAEADLARVEAAAIEMGRASRAEEGCREYAFYRDLEKPNRFRVYEEWESADALRAHFATPHMAEFNALLGTVTVERLEISQFEKGADVKVG